MQLAGCIIQDQTGKLLLIHRNTPEKTQWEIPGGKIEPGENPEQAAMRELKEELGVVVRIHRHLGNMHFREYDSSHRYDWFAAEVMDGALQLMEESFDEMRYFSIETLTAMKQQLSANAKNFVAAVQAEIVTL